MAFKRQEVQDHKTTMTKFLYDNLQDGIEEAIDLVDDAKEYIDEQIVLITKTGVPKLLVYPTTIIATEEGQTVFPIDLESFDVRTDTIFVQSGRTMLSPNLDFRIEGNNVVLKEGVPLDRNVDLYIFKNIPVGDEGSVTGAVIAPNTIPLNRLKELPTAEQIGAFPIVDAKGATFDMDVIIASGFHFRAYDTDLNTLGTPYKKGVSFSTRAMILSYGSSPTYGTQIAIASGANMYIRKLDKGVLSTWMPLVQKSSGSYTGNGSDVQRTIETGGTGRMIAITSAKGTAMLSTTGALTYNSTGVNGVIDSQAKLDTNGNITLATNNVFLNAIGVIYTWEFL